MMPIGYGHIWKCSNTPFSFSSHLTPSGPAGRNEWFWHLGACMTTHGIWSLPLLYYIDLLSKRNSSRQNHLAQSGERGREISYFSPPQTNGIGVDVTCLTVSTPVLLRSVIRPSGQWDFVQSASRSLCGAGRSWVSYRVYSPLILVDFPKLRDLSLSGLLSPKFEFVWISDVILFQSLMCLFLM